jgi:hypothetical protein
METKATVSAITLAFGASVTVGQLNFASSIAFETLERAVKPKDGKKFKMAQFAREVEEASGYSISAKTVQNAGTLAYQFQMKFGEKLASYEGGHTQDNVLAFAEFIKDQIKATTYTAKIDDLIAFCKGEQSHADKRAAEQAALDKAAAALAEAQAQAALKEQTQQADQKLADAQNNLTQAEAQAAKAEEERKAAEAKAEEERKAKEEADKRAELLKAQNERLAKEAEELRIKAAAEEAEKQRKEQERKQQGSLLCNITVDEHGKPVLFTALNPSPDALEAAAKELVAMAKAIRKAQRASLKQAA